jgi:hypothetical protein
MRSSLDLRRVIGRVLCRFARPVYPTHAVVLIDHETALDLRGEHLATYVGT